VIRIERGGAYFRVCGRTWIDPLDTSYARRYGGRWNPPGAFGALYLCATPVVAAAVARANFIGEIASLMDVLPSMLPDLLEVSVHRSQFVDAVSEEGSRALKLPTRYPYSVDWTLCQSIGKRAYEAGERGIACRSAAEATDASWPGEELALFDTQLALVEEKQRLGFDRWYQQSFIP
jgi:RES domain-containing protein